MKLWKSTSLGIAVVLILFVWIFVIGISLDQPGSFYNKDHNAVWLGHKWVSDAKTDQEVNDLVNRLADNGIDTVFVHSGPLEEDGSINPETYKEATAFLEKAKGFDDKIKYQAWLGQIRSKIDLEDENVRHNIVNEAFILTDLVGFDGVHYDIEPVWDEDEDFIELLQETRKKLGEDATISVALAEFIPRAVVWGAGKFKIKEFENYSTQINYKNVAKWADQIVVMAYDTGIDKEWLYVWLVKEQTIWLSRLLDGRELFVGLPSYEEEKEGFNPKVENISNGLKGVIEGLNNSRSDEDVFAGVAIYSYWETDSSEWGTYKELWTGNN